MKITVVVAAISTLAACSRDNADLTRAINADGARGLSASIAPTALEWIDLKAAQPGNDTLRYWPAAICMTSDRLVVADGSRRRLLITSPEGVPQGVLGSTGTAPGQFVELTTVRCAAGSPDVAAGDQALHRVSLYDLDSRSFRGILPIPRAPQVQVVGDLTPGPADGQWYASWLGTKIPLGPYLTDRQWRDVPLVESINLSGQAGIRIGAPKIYENPVVTRVFNRTFLAQRRDTLWVLTQGDATLRGFTAEGAEAEKVLLPVHFRGREPKISVGEQFSPSSEFRASRLQYHPNVQGLVMVQDSLFATIRYRDWGYSLVGKGLDKSVEQRARSAVEVFDRTGRTLASFEVPGYATEIASDGRSGVAVLTSTRDGVTQVLLGNLPARTSGIEKR